MAPFAVITIATDAVIPIDLEYALVINSDLPVFLYHIVQDGWRSVVLRVNRQRVIENCSFQQEFGLMNECSTYDPH